MVFKIFSVNLKAYIYQKMQKVKKKKKKKKTISVTL